MSTIDTHPIEGLALDPRGDEVRHVVSALAKADTTGLQGHELALAIRAAERLGFVRKDAGPGADGTSSIMVCWKPPAALATAMAVPGGTPAASLHMTLACVDGSAGDVDPNVVLACAVIVAQRWPTIPAVISGFGRFALADNQDALFLTVDSPGLADMRDDLCDELASAGIDVMSNHGFTPHITLEQCDRDAERDYTVAQPIPISIDGLTVVSGTEQTTEPFQADAAPDSSLGKELVYQVTKSTNIGNHVGSLRKNGDGELQYTLGALYVPDQLDAHGEFAPDDALHEAMLEYSLNSDRRMRLQHDPTTEAGTWVELMRLPAPMDTPITKADGTTDTVTLPAGTIMMGVIWDDQVWPFVKSGQLGGLSMGGRAIRVKDSPSAPTTVMGAAKTPTSKKPLYLTGDEEPGTVV